MIIVTEFDKLPPIYATWYEYWLRLNEYIEIDTIDVVFRDHPLREETGYTEYKCKLDFIKARCFEEMQKVWKDAEPGPDSHLDWHGMPVYYFWKEIDERFKIGIKS